MDEINQLNDRSLEDRFDFGGKGKKTVIIDASERTRCEVWSRVIRLLTPWA